jgi:hypothetical protein
VTESAAAPGSVRSLLAQGWDVAVRRALLAFAIVVAVAEAAALGVVALGGTSLSLPDALRVGGLYVAAFHRVPLRLSADGEGLSRVASFVLGPSRTAEVEVTLAVAPLAATALAAWLLWHGGRAVAQAAGGSPPQRALHGAKVAPVYAVALLLVCLLVQVHVPFLQATSTPGQADLGPVPAWGFALAFVLAAVAGAAGGWWSGVPRPDRAEVPGRCASVRAAVAGGWTMLVAGLLASYAGLFLAGVVRPDGPEAILTPSTGRYFQSVFARPATGAVVLAHHLALAPNEAVWVLVPAMGGCTGVFPVGGEPDPFLCYGRFPRDVALPAWVAPPPSTAGPVTGTRFGVAPAAYFLFLLAPAVGTVLGGRRVALEAGAAGLRRLAVLAAGAAVVSAALVVAIGWAASISASGTLLLDGADGSSGAVRVGPGLPGAGLLGLAWGVVGGVPGAFLTRWTAGSPSPAGSRRG